MNGNVSKIKSVTLVGLWINVALVVVKLFFGYWGNSDALVADGYHSFSDFVTDFIVIIFVAASYKKADSDHPYGHGKFQTVATVLIGMILLTVGFLIGLGGCRTLWDSVNGKELPGPDMWTLYVAVISILLKEFCYRYTIHFGRMLGSPALVANAWHHRSDAISSVAVVAGVSCALFMGEQWRIMDPTVSIIIAAMIVASSVKIITPAVNELLEKGLPDAIVHEMENEILSVPGIIRVHNLRARMNGHYGILDFNIHVDPDITVRESHTIATQAEELLRRKYGNDMIIYIHIEPEMPIMR